MAIQVKNEKKKKTGEMEDTSVTMKDLWQALRAGGGFISLLSTKSPPPRCSTYPLCSALSHCSVSVLALSRSMLTSAAATIHNLAGSPNLTSYLSFSTHSPPTFPLLFLLVSLTLLFTWPSCLFFCLFFSQAHFCFITLTASLPLSLSLSRPLFFPPCRWSIFCLLCLRRLFSPHSLAT